MMHSMTAFARMHKQVGEFELCWESRSLNHRYLEINFRLPDAWRFLEADLRAEIKSKFSRGKIDCTLKLDEKLSSFTQISINKELVQSFLELASSLAREKQLPNDLSISTVLARPELFAFSKAKLDESLAGEIIISFKENIESLKTSRKLEGQALKEILYSKLRALKQELALAESKISNTKVILREKMLRELSSLQLSYEVNRIEQELVCLLMKFDVNEEIQRLHCHLKAVEACFASQQAEGRRLDFLMQELGREANTLASKAASTELNLCAIEMKLLIEQMREQIQNIE